MFLCSLFLWSVPFLCWMAIVILMVAAVVVYFVPLRLIILVWGEWVVWSGWVALLCV